MATSKQIGEKETWIDRQISDINSLVKNSSPFPAPAPESKTMLGTKADLTDFYANSTYSCATK